AQAAHVPGHHGPRAALVCHQPVHLRDGTLGDRSRADPQSRRPHRSDAVRRSRAAGARVDGDRHQFRDDGAAARRNSRRARIDRDRSCRRARGRRMNAWLVHLPVLPVVSPLFAGAAMLLVPESRRVRAALGICSVLIQLAAAIALLWLTTDAVRDIWSQGIGVYSIGKWPAPFGIVLVVDRLSALMLLLTATVALASLIYSLARWDRVGVHFHPLFQLLLMGVNGSFLTGDLFNLFVFVEVLLAASYGLLLHGSGAVRVKAGLHYIIINLVASLLFLIGIALIYGVAGTLNMADLGPRAAQLADVDRGLFDIGATILGIAFLIKAASWPLNFWLPIAYSAAGAPVAAVFALLTKVGVYAIIRVGALLNQSGVHGPFGSDWLFFSGIATIFFGLVGMLAAQQLARLVAFSV